MSSQRVPVSVSWNHHHLFVGGWLFVGFPSINPCTAVSHLSSGIPKEAMESDHRDSLRIPLRYHGNSKATETLRDAWGNMGVMLQRWILEFVSVAYKRGLLYTSQRMTFSPHGASNGDSMGIPEQKPSGNSPSLGRSISHFPKWCTLLFGRQAAETSRTKKNGSVTKKMVLQNRGIPPHSAQRHTYSSTSRQTLHTTRGTIHEAWPPLDPAAVAMGSTPSSSARERRSMTTRLRTRRG